MSSRGTVQTPHWCPMCLSLPLTLKPPVKLVKHIAQHILHDPIVRARTSPCGFCSGLGVFVSCLWGRGREGIELYLWTLLIIQLKAMILLYILLKSKFKLAAVTPTPMNRLLLLLNHPMCKESAVAIRQCSIPALMSRNQSLILFAAPTSILIPNSGHYISQAAQDL